MTDAQRKNELSVATFNVENLDPTDSPAKFAALARLMVHNLRSPDLFAIEEVQDNSGPAPDPSTDASLSWQMLIAAIEAQGGPTYDYRQINPLFNQDGGEPGGNIRQGFLFRTDRGLSFVDRPGGTAVTPNEVVDTHHGAELLYSPGGSIRRTRRSRTAASRSPASSAGAGGRSSRSPTTSTPRAETTRSSGASSRRSGPVKCSDTSRLRS